MKTNFFTIVWITIIAAFIFVRCSGTIYEGTYIGTLPCADCAGIETEITINDGKYMIKRTYLMDNSQEQSMYVESRMYKWDKRKSILILDNDPEQQYLFRDNTLVALDSDGNEITGDLADLYVLKRK